MKIFWLFVLYGLHFPFYLLHFITEDGSKRFLAIERKLNAEMEARYEWVRRLNGKGT